MMFLLFLTLIKFSTIKTLISGTPGIIFLTNFLDVKWDFFNYKDGWVEHTGTDPDTRFMLGYRKNIKPNILNIAYSVDYKAAGGFQPFSHPKFGV